MKTEQIQMMIEINICNNYGLGRSGMSAEMCKNYGLGRSEMSVEMWSHWYAFVLQLVIFWKLLYLCKMPKLENTALKDNKQFKYHSYKRDV